MTATLVERADAVGAIIHALQQVDPPVPRAEAIQSCLAVLRQLYGNDAAVLLDKAVGQPDTADHRFMAIV